MIKHYLKFFVRNLTRQKGFTFINVAGLAIGMAVSILILLYIINELSYDRFYSADTNKYRVNGIIEFSGATHQLDRSCPQLGLDAMLQCPEVIQSVSLYDEQPYVKFGEKLFHESSGDVYFAQNTVFDFFSIELISGSKESVFLEPMSVVISEEKAKKYFGNEDPIDKILMVNDVHPLKVTGVFKNYPANAHVKFGMLAPMEALLEVEGVPDLRMLGNSSLTYVEVRNDFDEQALCTKLAEITDSYIPAKLKEQMNIKFSHHLQSVRKIHLYTTFKNFDEESSGRIIYVYIFSAIAVFILLLACVNFMNLSTARYANRAKEVGLRKIIGAGKPVLVKQFLGESIFISYIALFTAVVLAELFLPVFNNLIEKELTFIYQGNWQFILALMLLGLIVGFISGSYPALFLTSFNPLSILQGKLKSGKGSIWFRWSLVVFQFVIAIVLVSCTLVIFYQMNYTRNKDLGFKRDNLVIVMLRGSEIHKNMKGFKDELDKIPGVMNYTFTSDKPGISTSWYSSNVYEGREDEDHPIYATVSIDENYMGTIGLQITQGRNFSEDFSTDTASMIINESMVEYLGWEEPVGKAIYEMTEDFGRKKYTVVGVVKDFHMESLHKSISPLHLQNQHGHAIAFFESTLKTPNKPLLPLKEIGTTLPFAHLTIIF
ncbi:MAG: ABC transporter permease [Bacteroidales bacterium]